MAKQFFLRVRASGTSDDWALVNSLGINIQIAGMRQSLQYLTSHNFSLYEA